MMRNAPLPSRLARTGCSVLALATVFIVGPSPAVAQSFLGTGTATNGAATTITNGPGTTTISVTAPQTVINWVPTDNATNSNVPIVFQNSGTTASFLGTGNYAVLNNIAATDLSRVISMNGTITAGALSNAAANGSIYFYSPSGILLGGTSMINVGSLVMSASPIVVDGGGNFINGAATVIFGQALRSTAAVTTNAGSAINATAGDAYVAMVAPRVQHGGSINVNGSAALVGAEAATINFSPDGLFDIQVTAGTTDVNGVYNNGNIVGSASTGATDIHRAYLVAVPKNAALTMLITTGSDLGFNVAGAANVVGNTVILSAGHDIANGLIAGVSAGSTGSAIAHLEVRDSNFTSAVIGEATGFAHFFAFSALSFSSDVEIHADGDIWFSTQTALGTVDVDGRLTLSTERHGANGQAVTASLIDVYNLNGAGRITVDGLTTLDADAYGGDSNVSGANGGNAIGGEIDVVASGGGTIELLGGLIASADGHGGTAFVAGADGGTGTGGDISLRTGSTNGIVRVAGFTDLSSTGYGGNGNGGECFACDGDGGAGQGGEIRIYTGDGTGSSMTITGAVNATAGGFGGSASSSTAAIAGVGTGGVAAYYVGTAGVMTLTGNLSLQADGHGGDHSAASAGSGYGGQAALSETVGATSGTIAITGNVELSSDGTGGDSFAAGALGGDGYGGIGIGANGPTTINGATIVTVAASTTINGTVDMHSNGTGGQAVNGTGGTGHGGEARIRSENFLRITGNLTSTAEATGGQGATGGQANGGDILIRALAGGDLQLLGATNLASTNATGGEGANGNGGNAVGGDVTRIYADGVGSTVTISGATTVTSNATGGSSQSGAGGTAGGGVTAVSTAGGTIIFDDDVLLSASATGGSAVSGSGGSALGGAARVQTAGGAISIAGDLTLMANATGGNGGSGMTAGDGGDARTGTIAVESKDRFAVPTERGTLIVGSIVGSATATGGSGATAGTSTVVDGSYFRVLNGDATIGSVAITLSGDLIDSTLGPSFVSVRDGAATIGTFSFVTDGTLSLDANGGAMNAGLITLNAVNFVPHTANPVPTNPGTYFANSFAIQTGNNFITTANLDSVATLTIVAPGAIQIGNVTGDNSIVLNALGAEVDIGNVLAGGVIDIHAQDFIFTGNIVGNGVIDFDAGSSIDTGSILNTGNTSLNAGTSINVGAINSGLGSVSLVTDNSGDISGSNVVGGSIYADSDGDIFLGNLAAPGDIELVAIGDMLIGNALAGETIDLDAGGYIDGGSMTAGDSVYAEAGDYVDLLDVSAGIVDQSSGYDADYNVGILAGTTIDTGDIAAFNSIGLGAAGNIYTGSIDAGNIFLALSGGNMSFGTINAGQQAYFADDSMIALGGDPTEGDFDPAPITILTPTPSGGSITLRGAVTTGRFVAAAGTTLTGTTIDSGSSIYTFSGGNMTLTDLDAGSSIFQRSGGIIAENDLDAGSYIDIRSTGGLALGDLVAGDYIDLRSSGAIGLGNATSGETINFLTGSTVTGGAMTAGDSVLAEATGAIQLGAITAGITDPSTSPSAEYVARFSSSGAITTGNVNAVGRIGFATPTNLLTGNLSTGEGLSALVGGNITAGAINASDYVYLANYSMASLGGTFADFDPAPILALAPVATGGSITLGAVSTGRFEAAAGTTLTGTTINSGGLLYATSGGTMALGNLVAGNDVRLTSGGNIVTGSIYSYDDVALVATGSILTLDIFAYDDVSADAGTTISTDDITGNSIELFADGDITTGDLLTRNFFFGAEAHALIPGTSITVVSGGNVDVGTIDALDGVHVSADGTIGTGTIDAETFVELFAGGNITAGTINAGSYIDIFSDTGLLDLDDLHAGTEIDLESEGSLQFGDATADDFNFEMGGSVDGGNIDAVAHADGHADGAIVLENITVTGPPTHDDDFSIGFTSATSIEVENVDGFDRVGFATLGNLNTGTITAGSLVVTLVGGDIVTGSITTDANGRVYMADASMCQGACGDDDSDVEIESIIALAPVPTGGSINVNGAITTGSLQAAAGDNLVTRAITANSIDASAGDTAVIEGIWNAPSVSLASGGINITADGRIDAGTSGSILLNAVSTDGPALIGDGLTGNGYALSNAEFGRLSGGEITIAVGGSGGDADTMIGDLTITGPLAGSNIESSDGGVHFITLGESGDELDGTLRVVGDVVATGFGADNYLSFYTQNFELDAATGSIAITSSGNALAGVLELYASRIHIAEGTLLDQLAANPQFTGYREALNQQAAVQRPEGVIRAANFDIEFGGSESGGPYTLYVQNMGTSTVPAGFLLNAANIGDDGEGSLAPGSVDMAINGQIITATGTLTGTAVRDLLVAEFGTTAFAAGSTINGCVLVGPCGVAPARPQIVTPTSTDVPLSDDGGLGDGSFGNEGDIDDGESGDGDARSSPISPPNPLFDSRPLVQSGDIDDPVSGAGNPSLYGSPDDDTEQCDKDKDNICKVGKQGDGK